MTEQISLKRNDWVFHTGPWFKAIRVLVDVSIYLDILLLGSSILTWVSADTASVACPSQPGNLEMISMTFAAVIWDADDPCSVNTTDDPESSFLAEYAAGSERGFWPRIVLRSCVPSKRTSESVLVLTPQEDFDEMLRTHEKAKCWCAHGCGFER